MPLKPDHAPARRRRSRLVRPAVAVSVVCAVATGGAYGAGWGPFAPRTPHADPVAVAQARAFLADWAAGRTERAGARTTSPDQAKTVLRSFTTGLDISKPDLSAGRAKVAKDGTVTVPFIAKMPVTDMGTWTYESVIPVRRQENGSWKITWSLPVVHPKLSSTDKFRLTREDTTSRPVTDRNGSACPRKPAPP